MIKMYLIPQKPYELFYWLDISQCEGSDRDNRNTFLEQQ